MSASYGNVYVALAAQVESLAASLKLPVDMPNVDFTRPTATVEADGFEVGDRLPYLAMTYMPNTSEHVGLALDSDLSQMGLLQVSVFWPSDRGVVKPLTVASKVADALGAGTVLDAGDGVTVNVDRAPSVATPIQESDWVQVPVTVRWRACVPS